MAKIGSDRGGQEKVYNLGYLVSGGGSNFRAIDDAIRDGRLERANSGLVISSLKDAGALQIAHERQIPKFFLDHTRPASDLDPALRRLLETYDTDIVVMAGYLQKLGSGVLDAFPNRVLNIHPAPTDRFGGQGMFGHHVHDAVVDSGVRWTGPTVHLADENFDEGTVLAHWPVATREGEGPTKLAVRELQAEHHLYWRAIRDTIFRLDHPEIFSIEFDERQYSTERNGPLE